MQSWLVLPLFNVIDVSILPIYSLIVCKLKAVTGVFRYDPFNKSLFEWIVLIIGSGLSVSVRGRLSKHFIDSFLKSYVSDCDFEIEVDETITTEEKSVIYIDDCVIPNVF